MGWGLAEHGESWVGERSRAAEHRRTRASLRGFCCKSTGLCACSTSCLVPSWWGFSGHFGGFLGVQLQLVLRQHRRLSVDQAKQGIFKKL